MILFFSRGGYERRAFIEKCLDRYLEISKMTKTGDGETVRAPNDKPYFKDYPDIRFSLSHSGDVIVLAMGKTEVGVDIEQVKPRDYLSIANRHFSAAEVAQINSLEDFLSLWTKKEAYLKLTGEGLSGLSNAEVVKPLEYLGQSVVLTPIDVIDGCIGAIAAPAQPIIIEPLS